MAGPMELWVRAADANEPRIILKDLTEDGRSASG
jgi:hypothetical protein